MGSAEPRALRLTEDAVHVWAASLDVGVARFRSLGRHLSDDERDRALRLRSRFDRTRFVAARGILRELAGRYLFFVSVVPRNMALPWLGKAA